MSLEDDIKAYTAERNRILEELDIEAFYRQVPELEYSVLDRRYVAANPPEVVAKKRKMVALAAMHKARFEITTMPDNLRHASRVWLTRHGYTRLRELPWPPEGALP